MKQSKKIARLLGALLLTTSSTVHCTPAESLQNSQQAVEFFTHELEFKTNPHGAKAVVDGKVKNVTIVDLRTANDFAKGHIPGAINVPWDQHKSFDGDETSFPELRKDGYNYVYCYELLCNLGQKAAKKFASLGYPVKEMVGGFDEWEKKGHPIER
jgi:rhodanese-related sulfurtransferase